MGIKIEDKFSNRTVKKWHKLFSLYSANLSMYQDHLVIPPEIKAKLHECFVCPLCLEVFDLVAIECGYLREEHVVSRKAGGRLTTLSCQPCNSSSGSILESHLLRRLEVTGLRVPVDMELKLAGNLVRGTFAITDDRAFQIALDRERCNPSSHDRAMESMSGDMTFTVTITPGYNERRAQLAVLRSAYLTMFAYYGYEFLIMWQDQIIREQINNPNQQLLDVISAVYMGHVMDSLPINSIAVVVLPEEMRGFIVTLGLCYARHDHIFQVFLPGPGQDSTQLYGTLASLRQTKGQVNLACWLLAPRQERLGENQHKWQLYKSWTYLMRQELSATAE